MFRNRASWLIRLRQFYLFPKLAEYAVVLFRLLFTICAENELISTELVSLPLSRCSQIRNFIISDSRAISPFALKRIFKRSGSKRSVRYYNEARSPKTQTFDSTLRSGRDLFATHFFDRNLSNAVQTSSVCQALLDGTSPRALY